MLNWFIPTLFSLVCFGLWGFFSKLALFNIDSKSTFIYQTIGALIIGLLAFSQMGFKPALHTKGMTYGILTGAAYGIGCLLFLMAAQKGKIVTVVTITGLYPLITLVLAYTLLKEPILLKQWFGIILALIAITLLST